MSRGFEGVDSGVYLSINEWKEERRKGDGKRKKDGNNSMIYVEMKSTTKQGNLVTFLCQGCESSSSCSFVEKGVRCLLCRIEH